MVQTPLIGGHPSEPEIAVYGFVGDELFWGNTYAGTNVGHLKKTNLSTEVTTSLKTGNFLAAWLGLVEGADVFAGGEEKDGGGIFRATLYKIISGGVTTVFHPDTDDCNELVGIASDGVNIVAGERATGGLNANSLWPNGAGLWKIPIATYNDPATWSRVYEDPDLYEWASITKMGSAWYALLAKYASGKWKVIKSFNLSNWTTELDYTAQALGQGSQGMMIKTGTELVVLAPVAVDSKFHMFVFDGSSWTDYSLNVAIPGQNSTVRGFWHSGRCKVMILVSRMADNEHNKYDVRIDGTGLLTLDTNKAGEIRHLGSRFHDYTKNGITYYPATLYTASSSYIIASSFPGWGGKWTGSMWVGTADERAAIDPKYLVEGMRWFETDTDKNYCWNGTSWDEMVGITGIEIQEDDVKVADIITLNFEGGGGKVTDEGGGKVTVDITPGGDGGVTPIWEQIWEAFDANTDPVDVLIQSGAYRVFIFFSSHNAASWKTPTNATYTVPAGKKLLVIQKGGSEALIEDTVSRRARFRNITDGSDVLDFAAFQGTGAFGFAWAGDVGDPSKLVVVAAGKTARLELWNSDATKRAMGALVICREVAA